MDQENLKVKLSILRKCYLTLNIPECNDFDEMTALYTHYLSEAHKLEQLAKFKQYYLGIIVMIETIYHVLLKDQTKAGLAGTEMYILHAIDSTKELTKRLQGFLEQLKKEILLENLEEEMSAEELSLDEMKGILDKILKNLELDKEEISLMGIKTDPMTLLRSVFE